MTSALLVAAGLSGFAALAKISKAFAALPVKERGSGNWGRVTRSPSQRAARRRGRHWYTWALAAGMTAAVVIVSVASAAQLSVLSNDHLTASATPCTTLTLPTTYPDRLRRGSRGPPDRGW